MVVEMMESIKNMMYFSSSSPVSPVVNQIGKCQIPHQNPMMIGDCNDPYFFWSSSNAKPLHPNSSPIGPDNRFLKKK